MIFLVLFAPTSYVAFLVYCLYTRGHLTLLMISRLLIKKKKKKYAGCMLYIISYDIFIHTQIFLLISWVHGFWGWGMDVLGSSTLLKGQDPQFHL